MLDSLANVKSRLGITETTNDTFLTQQIELISDVIEAYCRRRFLTADYRQTFYKENNRPTKNIELYHFPVTDILEINADGELIDDEEYIFHGPSGRIISKGITFLTGEETVIEYTAGYATCPRPILSVLDSLVQERYNKKTSGIDLNFGSDIQRISIPGSMSIDFDYTLVNNERKSAYGSILGNTANILDDWRSERSVVGEEKMSFIEEIPEVP